MLMYTIMSVTQSESRFEPFPPVQPAMPEVTGATRPPLAPNQRVEIPQDPSQFVLSPDEAFQKFNVNTPAIAGIEVADMKFWILKTYPDRNGERKLLLVDDDFESMELRSGDDEHFLEIPYGQRVSIGRDHYFNRFMYSDYVSGQQFKLEHGPQGLFIINGTPTNPTYLTLPPEEEPKARPIARPVLAQVIPRPAPPLPIEQRPVEISRTEAVIMRMQGRAGYGEPDLYGPHGYYNNMPILGSKSQYVNGGVYFGGSPREGIIVDGKSSELTWAYRGLQQRLVGRQPYPMIFHTVRNFVREIMPYDGRRTKFIADQYAGDRLVGLSEFLRARAGVCRHQGLLASYLVECLIYDRKLSGTVGVERDDRPDFGGPHGWGINRPDGPSTPEADVIVMDPAQNKAGPKGHLRAIGKGDYFMTTRGPYSPWQ